MKHSKYKNSGLLFELLTRQITVDALNNKPNSKATALIKKHFNKNSQLFKEAQIFTILQQTKIVNQEKAKHLIETTIKSYNKSINQKVLRKEKFNLIKSIKESFVISDFFKSRVPNYKLLASIYNVISEDYTNPVRSRYNF